MSVKNRLGNSPLLTQSLFEDLASGAVRRVQSSTGATDQDLADVIGCSSATVGNARNRNGKLSAHTLFNLLAVDPLALESLLGHFDRRSVPIVAKCDTDALPSTAGAVHKLAVVTADASPGGKFITDCEALQCEPEIDAAMEALASLKARCIAIRKDRAA
ncbi:hypothetical protein CDQ92_13270 [Sphingopyxis bauzanensis]|uniref:Uncharacterized protein n=1 Tax=Sphingopyxis bauzanensis TaxID=651663 RepID=A0A246JRV6_9SPHN|nr:hypothetical protein CDQ92_13270 [Sphingopyxis bauzanensis]GGJ39682.1 hypothetical protein GCM10011393_07430 [Sphingopyxis bauzanensis]